MEEMQLVETTEKIAEEMTEELNNEVEDRQPIPFGESGASFLRNITQHAVFLGVVALILMFIRIFGAQ